MLPLALLSGALALAAYVVTAGPTIYWLDSSEFVAASWWLGNAHPPGHPLVALLGRLFCYLPVGTIAFRVTLASAVQSAAAVGLLVVIAGELGARLRQGSAVARGLPGRPTPPALTLAATEEFALLATALTSGWAYALWFQAVRAEVYALHLLLVLAASAGLLRWERTRDLRLLLVGVFCGALALCNHHFLALLAALPAAIFIAVVWRQRAGAFGRVHGRRVLVAAVLVASVAMAAWAYLPLRSQRAPLVNWGAPHSWQRFGWVVSARAFQKALPRAAQQSREERGLGAVFAVLGGPPTGLAPALVGSLLLALALGGLYRLWREAPTRPAALLVTALLLGNLASPLLIGIDPFNADAHGYLALSVALLGPLAALPLLASFPRLLAGAGRRRTVMVSAGLLVLPALQLAVNEPRCSLSQHWAAEETGRAVLDQPAGSVLITSYFQTVFQVWSLQAMADLRPELELLHRNFLTQPGYLVTLRANAPELARWGARWRRSGGERVADLDWLARRRPVFVEYDLNLGADVVQRLWPAGMLLAYRPPRAALPDASAHERRIARWLRQVGEPDELETRRALSWWQYLLARFACRRGLVPLARFHLAQALTLAPQARTLLALRARCLPLLR
ncbi:MAG: DUF2723 domain-containing protein [Proteobacteria bacterium]|nr:DUF2723 domain-containing protein [Pseudomonadota bacterium]